MNNFKPGGIRHRRDDLGGRPRSDADYSTKGRFDKKPRHDARGGGNRYEDRGQKEVQLFQATCTTCGKSCEVPFRPDGTKPVLCRDCFATKNASPRSFEGREERPRFDRNASSDNQSDRNAAPSRPVAPTVDISGLTRQVAALEVKLNQVLEILARKPEAAKVAPTPVVETPKAAVKKEVVKKEKVAAVAKPKAPAKKAVAKKVAKVAKKTAKKVSKK